MEKIEALHRVYLIKEDVTLDAGDTTEVTNDRAKDLSDLGHVKILKEKPKTTKTKE